LVAASAFAKSRFEFGRCGKLPESDARSVTERNGERRASLTKEAPPATPVALSVTVRVGVTNARLSAARLANAASPGASAKMWTRPLAPAVIASSAVRSEPIWTTASLFRFFAAAMTASSTSRSMVGNTVLSPYTILM